MSHFPRCSLKYNHLCETKGNSALRHSSRAITSPSVNNRLINPPLFGMGRVVTIREEEGLARPLMPPETNVVDPDEMNDLSLSRRVWDETKKLWQIVGPAVFSRVAAYTMNIITQAFAGHLGAVELAAFSIANTVIVGFNFGLLVQGPSLPSFSLPQLTSWL